MAEYQPNRQLGGQVFGLDEKSFARLKDFSNACDKIRGDQPVQLEVEVVPDRKDTTIQPDVNRKNESSGSL